MTNTFEGMTDDQVGIALAKAFGANIDMMQIICAEKHGVPAFNHGDEVISEQGEQFIITNTVFSNIFSEWASNNGETNLFISHQDLKLVDKEEQKP